MNVQYFLHFQLDLFVQDELHSALLVDGLASSHPIFVAAKSLNDILQVYDLVSYRKVGQVYGTCIFSQKEKGM